MDAIATPSLGILIPRIALQAVNVAAPVTSPATSLLLYNIATASKGTNTVTPGYYYWEGAKWVRFNTGAFAGDNLGNHTPTTTLNMNNNFINNAQGSSIFAQSNNTSTSYFDAPIQLREAQFAGGVGAKAPRLSFHWSGLVASQIGLENSGRIAILNNPGTGYESFVAQEIYANGWVRNINSGTGLYNESNATGIFSPNAGIMAIYNNGSLGIGTTTPSEKLEVQGSVKIVDGTQGNGKVFTSDAVGKGSWKNSGLGAPSFSIPWDANITSGVLPQIYPNGIQTFGPFTVSNTGWYTSQSRWFFEQNVASNSDFGAGIYWIQIDNIATNAMDNGGTIYEIRSSTSSGPVCPPSGAFVYMISGTNYYVHQATTHCMSAYTGERKFTWQFVQ